VAWAAAGSLALAAATGCAVWGTVTDLETRPGVLTVAGVVVAGLAFCAFVFHAVRYAAARRFRRRPLPAAVLDVHLAGLAGEPPPGRQAPGIASESETDVGFP
jgi:hypothetical protein